MISKPGQRPIAFRMHGLEAMAVQEWIFCPGMLFQDTGKWWSDRGLRLRPHEGLDFLVYRDQADNLRHLHETSAFPVLYDGLVARIFPDFLGQSIIVEHTLPKSNAGRLYTIYGHTSPCTGIRAGMAVTEGDIIGKVAGADASPFPMAPHLHVSVGWASAPLPPDQLDWNFLVESDAVILMDPLDVIHCPHRKAKHADAGCRSL